MPRQIYAPIRAGFEASRSGDAILFFLTISHPELTAPLRVVSDTATINGQPATYSYLGNLYTALPFDFEILTDSDAAPTGRLSVTNVDRVAGEVVRSLATRPDLSIVILPASDFDMNTAPRMLFGAAHIIWEGDGLTLRSVKGDELSMSGDIKSIDDTSEPWPSVSATQYRTPGLFR